VYYGPAGAKSQALTGDFINVYQAPEEESNSIFNTLSCVSELRELRQIIPASLKGAPKPSIF
jgi:hypothetical protein